MHWAHRNPLPPPPQAHPTLKHPWVLGNLVTTPLPGPLSLKFEGRGTKVRTHHSTEVRTSPGRIGANKYPSPQSTGKWYLYPSPSTPSQTTVNYIYIPSSLSTSPTVFLNSVLPQPTTTYNYNHEIRRCISHSATWSTVIPSSSSTYRKAFAIQHYGPDTLVALFSESSPQRHNVF